jgi:hypothetical protein
VSTDVVSCRCHGLVNSQIIRIGQECFKIVPSLCTTSNW